MAHSKAITTIMVLVFSTLGSWLGAAMNHGDWFGFWSNLLGIVGLVVGVWVGHKIGDYIEG